MRQIAAIAKENARKMEIEEEKQKKREEEKALRLKEQIAKKV